MKNFIKNNKVISKEEISNIFFEEQSIPLSLLDIKHKLNINSPVKLAKAKEILDLMVKNGDIIFTKGGKYALPQKLHLIEGEVVSKKDNFSFVRNSAGGSDIYVKNSDLAGALPKDIVLLRVIPDSSHYLKNISKSNKKIRGSVVRIVKRQLESFMATVKLDKNIATLIPVSSNFTDLFYFDLHGFKDKKQIKDGIIVKAKLINPEDFSSRIVSVEKILGDIDGSGIEEEIIINKYNLYKDFDEETLKESDLIPANFEESDLYDKENKARRIDLTNLPFITIDGEDAKDFDDAIYLELINKKGNTGVKYKLYVAIADVSYFVKYGSKIDIEAYKRGNSTYFPAKVYPMLPERLSNNLCSLLPKAKRFVMVCEMLIDKHGKLLEKKVYEGIIKTFGRLTYNEVFEFISGVDNNEAEIKDNVYLKLNPIKDMLLQMKELSNILRMKRLKSGSLNFDPVSSKVIIDESGDVQKIVQEERNFANDLIEDFMITANCAVSELIESKNAPSLYRVHAKPDEEKINEFLKTIKPFGFNFSTKSLDSGIDYQKMLDSLKGKPISPFLEQAFLKSMKIAVYSNINIHHFGLALKSYTHFTSPIRRYADLIVHRILKIIIYSELYPETDNSVKNNNSSWWNNEYLKSAGGFISQRERLSTEAEREYAEFKKMQFLKKNAAEIYSGYITSVTNFGFFVQITGYFIAGFVHVSTIADDYYEYNYNTKILRGRHSGKIFKIGDEVEVGIYSIDLLKREIDLRLIENKLLQKNLQRSRQNKKIKTKKQNKTKTNKK
ncbi:MAG: ribonuclease R [Candidatus Acididesulfobacter diazotrophicus]|uniref:Ribonuclease R n=1 Tax=Candidatus Acididesulfobacter diazotrophicus TaxID=2597226 RepID=A0A519BNS0_9DELT|nr:MAG: ribonuclease R [Candidatus Acididesulfobacter diazotrophicus]